MFKQIETKPFFPSANELFQEYKAKFIGNGFVNCQDLIVKSCVTDTSGITNYVAPLSVIDPSVQPLDPVYVCPDIPIFIKFPISNGEIHVVKNALFEFPECTTGECDTNSNSVPSNTDD